MKTSEASPQLKVTYVPLSTLLTNTHNARTHSSHQVRQIAGSIKSYGFNSPILIDRDNTIIAGHGRLAAAQLLGMTEVPVIRIEFLTDGQIRAYMIADNKLAENASWDTTILASEFQYLLSSETNIDVTDTGFEVSEIDLILEEASSKPDNDDSFATDTTGPAVTQPGDLWQLGKHRILCDSSLLKDSYDLLMGQQRAHVVFTDPPYNVAIDGNVSGKGSVHHREFAMASGEMTEPEFLAFLITNLRFLARFSKNGSVHFICMDWRHVEELSAAGKHIYDELLNVCVWVKNNGGMGSFYRSRHELIFAFCNGKGRHRNNVLLGQFGRNRTNVWEYAGASALSKQGEEGNLLALHPTVKPVAMIADALLDCSARGEVVLDAFLGSGSTLIAAERVGRICYGIEIDPIYVDVAIRRWQTHTGDRAIHAATGKSFDEISAGSEAIHE